MTVAYLTRDASALQQGDFGGRIEVRGDHFLVRTPGGVCEKVPLHRHDIAAAIASGLLPQSALHPPAQSRDVPARSAMTLTGTDIDVIGDAVGTALRERDRRITNLELACAAVSKPARDAAASARGTKKLSTRAVCLLATAAVASARATLASR